MSFLRISLTGLACGAALATGCAWFPSGGAEEPERRCEQLPEEGLPSLGDLLDPTDLVAYLRSDDAGEDEAVLTLAVYDDGIRIFTPLGENSAPVGFWPVLLRESLSPSLPEGAAPGFRVRLIPGPQGRVELEPATLCPPVLRNEAEVEERYRSQFSEAGVVPAEVAFTLSDLGGIRQLDVTMPEGHEADELLARRALHFARFQPALLDGRRTPSVVRMRFPPER